MDRERRCSAAEVQPEAKRKRLGEEILESGPGFAIA